MKVCCFAGHCPQGLPFGYNETDERCKRLKAQLKAEIIKLIEGHGVTCYISGMAMGTDMYAAELVLELKEKYPQITLECAIPCESQAEKWSEPLRDRYFGIIERCDKETLLQTRYTPDCMQKRNEYMVKKSDCVLAVWNGSVSGTEKTVRFARMAGKDVTIINPDTL